MLIKGWKGEKEKFDGGAKKVNWNFCPISYSSLSDEDALLGWGTIRWNITGQI